MSVRIIPKEQQGYGAFNGGEIVENKPIGFPQDRSSIRPYSNLFYWAHARAVTDSTIGLHPHQGFEICSFVLKGEIRHYDTKLRDWRPLKAGDVQIIRAGSGISHSEWMGEGSEMFQIWFDPNLTATLEKPASYDDYAADKFPVTDQSGMRITTLAGGDSPFSMDTPGVSVRRIELEAGKSSFPVQITDIQSVYVLNGTPVINGSATGVSDFLLIDSVEQLDFETENPATLFIISSPAVLPYRSYTQLRNAAH